MMRVNEAQLRAANSDPVEACDQTNRVVDVAGEDTILACCGLRYYEARFRRSPTPAEKAGVHWEIRDQSTKKPVTEPLDKEIRKDMILLRHLSPNLAGRGIEVRAWLCSADQEGKKQVKVQLSGVSEFIGLVKKLEDANPSWNGGQVADAIRRLARYDDQKWQVMLGQSGPANAITPTGNLTQADIDRLRAFTSHSGDVAGSERGVGDDCFGRGVALGHVITGLCAGLHRNTNLDYGNLVKPDWVLWSVGSPLDNLYAATLSGDLGQSACYNYSGGQTGNSIGDHTEATEAELIGDIDGLLLGQAKGPSLGGAKLSDVLKDYYCKDDLDAAPLAAAKRFELFDAVSHATVIDQSKRFARNYIYAVSKWGAVTHDTDPDVDAVCNTFYAWLGRQKTAETARRDKAKKDYEAFKKR